MCSSRSEYSTPGILYVPSCLETANSEVCAVALAVRGSVCESAASGRAPLQTRLSGCTPRPTRDGPGRWGWGALRALACFMLGGAVGGRLRAAPWPVRARYSILYKKPLFFIFIWGIEVRSHTAKNEVHKPLLVIC